MLLTELVFAQAVLLAGQLNEQQNQLLQVLCNAACSSLTARMRDGFTPEDCKAEFVAAASLYALAALNEAGQTDRLEEFRAGDLTIRKNPSDAPSRCLYRQAELMMMPFLKDNFVFQGV